MAFVTRFICYDASVVNLSAALEAQCIVCMRFVQDVEA